jgi:hypothetical protein
MKTDTICNVIITTIIIVFTLIISAIAGWGFGFLPLLLATKITLGFCAGLLIGIVGVIVILFLNRDHLN